MNNLAEKSTELRIKEAARSIFQKRGFSGTTTRDIAEKAGINLALLNYYYRSKKKLYDIIMTETICMFFSDFNQILNDAESSLHKKMTLLVERYIDMLSKNLNMPMFIMHELQSDPKGLVDKIGVLGKIKRSKFISQFKQAVASKEIPPINPIHFLVNLLGLTVFPFMVMPMVAVVAEVEEKELLKLMQERKKLIPLWKEAMLKVS